MNTQKDPGQVPLTIAGPSERAGLIEQPSIGRRTAWAQKTANPMAIGANAFEMAFSLLTAV